MMDNKIVIVEQKAVLESLDFLVSRKSMVRPPESLAGRYSSWFEQYDLLIQVVQFFIDQWFDISKLQSTVATPKCWHSDRSNTIHCHMTFQIVKPCRNPFKLRRVSPIILCRKVENVLLSLTPHPKLARSNVLCGALANVLTKHGRITVLEFKSDATTHYSTAINCIGDSLNTTIKKITIASSFYWHNLQSFGIVQEISIQSSAIS
jgi:hypothetical protein